MVNLLLFFVFLSSGGRAAKAADSLTDWPQFRGLAGAASGPATLPVQWDFERHVRWRRELPGPGGSSPIVVGEQIFLTAYSGYGVDAQSPGDSRNLVRHLLCLDRGDGRLLWQRDIPADGVVDNYVDFRQQHGYATSTPVSDGRRVFVSFENSGVFAFDLSGEPLWHRKLGNHVHNWGSAGSLTVDERYLFVNAAVEDKALLALDKLSGDEVWRFERVIGSWSTPTPIELSDGRRELLLNVKQQLLGIDRESGRRLWSYKTDQAVAASTPTVVDGVIYCCSGSPKFVAALRPGAGDLEPPTVIWRTDGVGSGIASPLVYEGHVYIVDRSVAVCLAAGTGKIVAKTRLTPSDGTFYASPVAAGKTLFAVSRESGVYVLSTAPEFKQLAHNTLDASVFNGTPAVHGGELLLRSDRYLYCIGAEKADVP